MPESRLQSDMLQNMGRSQMAAMFQRGQIAANQRDWMNYVQARDSGAFYGDPYGGDSSGEHLIGRANPYLKYYAAMQAKQIAFQRQRFLNAQRFQNDYMLQQQKFMNEQAAEEQEVTRNKQEMERKLSVVSSELDALENNPEIDKNSWEYKARRQQLLDDRYELETELERNTPQVHEQDSGFKDSQGNPIMSTFIIGPDGKPIYHVQGKDVAANQLERDKFEQAKIDAARKANHDEKVLALDEKKAETERAAQRLKQKQDERKESGADPIAAAKKAHGTAAFKSLLDERKLEIKAELESSSGDLGKKYSKATPSQQEVMINEELKKRDEMESSAYKVSDRSPIPGLKPAPRGTPTKGEVEEEAMKRYDRTQPTPDDELNDQAMYESPMDPEFSDEQFAGTEPAGLYDPTGQPLPMDGGMYNGLA